MFFGSPVGILSRNRDMLFIGSFTVFLHGFRIMDDVILSVINVSNLLLFLTGFLRGSKRAMMSVIQVYG